MTRCIGEQHSQQCVAVAVATYVNVVHAVRSLSCSLSAVAIHTLPWQRVQRRLLSLRLQIVSVSRNRQLSRQGCGLNGTQWQAHHHQRCTDLINLHFSVFQVFDVSLSLSALQSVQFGLEQFKRLLTSCIETVELSMY